MLTGVDDLTGNNAVLQDAPFVIHIFEKQIEGGEALGEPAFDCFPLGAGNDARKKVVRDDALGTFIAVVDGERDALIEEGKVRFLLAAQKLLGRQIQKLGVQRAVVARARPFARNISS